MDQNWQTVLLVYAGQMPPECTHQIAALFVMAAMLKVIRLCQSMCIYLKNNHAKFHSEQI